MKEKSSGSSGNIHFGRRERMREKFIKNGINAFSDHEIIEFLLYYTNVRKDTNSIAHNLINEFNGLENVFAASVEKLEEVDGIGEKSALLLNFFGQLKSKRFISVVNKNAVLATTADAGNYCCDMLYCCNVEKFMILSLNTKRGVIAQDVICEGDDRSAQVDIRKVVKTAIDRNASCVILAHNHLNDSTYPSGSDVALTNKIVVALELMDIPVIDHIICSGSMFTSMSEKGLMDSLV